jgi:hypothetical protein
MVMNDTPKTFHNFTVNLDGTIVVYVEADGIGETESVLTAARCLSVSGIRATLSASVSRVMLPVPIGKDAVKQVVFYAVSGRIHEDNMVNLPCEDF